MKTLTPYRARIMLSPAAAEPPEPIEFTRFRHDPSTKEIAHATNALGPFWTWWIEKPTSQNKLRRQFRPSHESIPA
jgi:hypothetical protein